MIKLILPGEKISITFLSKGPRKGAGTRVLCKIKSGSEAYTILFAYIPDDLLSRAFNPI